MDITAMLNTSVEGNAQSKGEDNLGNSFRSRTPWDAGGYSLPIHTHHLEPFTDYAFPSDSPNSHIDELRHKSSDSHSSLSSFTSSNCISHSRFSSMSTVNSLQLPSQNISETILTDSETSSHSSKTATESCSPASPRTGRSTSRSSSSPALYGNGLVLIAERTLYRPHRKESIDHLFTVAESAKACSADFMDVSTDERLSTISSRPASPSDAILIKRTTPPLVHYPAERHIARGNKCSQGQVQTLDINSSDQQPTRVLEQKSGHKRAASAPDAPGIMAQCLERGYNDLTVPNAIIDISSSSSLPRTSLPAVPASSTTLTPPLEAAQTSQDRRPCCMYIANCDTGSQLRKAVSHIFGRNKMCTRRIPPQVWVWYCRKHYQRARYRNAKEWARTLQHDLVSRQIKRLEEWSEENLRAGAGAVVQDYRLAIRKREQRRLDAQKPKGGHESSDSEVEETSELQSEASSSTAVPDWLFNLSGRNHKATKIMEILNGIQADLTQNNLSAWPDIEILPNIILGRDESEASKVCTKRKVLLGAHARSQSLGSTARAHESLVDPLAIQESRSPPDRKCTLGSNLQKRKRSEDREAGDDLESTPQSQRIRVTGRQVAAARQGSQPIQRPVFRNSRDNQSSERTFGNINIGQEYNTLATGSHSIPLATLKPQRYSTLATGAYIDPRVPFSKENSTRPGLHRRSHSDMGNLNRGLMPSRLSTRYRHHSAAPVQYDKPTFRRFLSPPALQTSSPHTEGPIRPHQAHTRHESTPVLSSFTPSPFSYPAGCRTLPRISPPSPSSSLDVVDSVKALDLHSRRRQ